jgi:hypothetical protein
VARSLHDIRDYLEDSDDQLRAGAYLFVQSDVRHLMGFGSLEVIQICLRAMGDRTYSVWTNCFKQLRHFVKLRLDMVVDSMTNCGELILSVCRFQKAIGCSIPSGVRKLLVSKKNKRGAGLVEMNMDEGLFDQVLGAINLEEPHQVERILVAWVKFGISGKLIGIITDKQLETSEALHLVRSYSEVLVMAMQFHSSTPSTKQDITSILTQYLSLNEEKIYKKLKALEEPIKEIEVVAEGVMAMVLKLLSKLMAKCKTAKE